MKVSAIVHFTDERGQVMEYVFGLPDQDQLHLRAGFEFPPKHEIDKQQEAELEKAARSLFYNKAELVRKRQLIG